MGDKDMKKHFAKDNRQMTEKHVRRYFPRATRENANKYHDEIFHSDRKSKNKNKTVTIPNAHNNVDKPDLSHIAGGNIKWHSHSGKWY